MPFKEIPLADITVGERFRKDLGKIDDFAAAIKSRGYLLQPLIVDKDLNLLGGGRRYAATKSLGWQTVPVRIVDGDMDDLTRREIELEENVLRLELAWQERSKLTLEIDRLYKLKYGQARVGRPTGTVLIGGIGKGHLGAKGTNTIDDSITRQDGWSSTANTAELRGVSRSTVQRDLELAYAMEVMPSLADEDNQTNALRKKARLIEDIERELLLRQRKNSIRRLDSCVLQGDATQLILSLETHSVDCVITDPPYGDDVLPFGQPHRTEKEFDDSPESTLALLRSIGPELRRVLKPSGHLYAFFGPKLWQQSIDIWRNSGFDVRKIIGIWHKTGGATGTVNWDFDFAPDWEPFLLAHNGERRLANKHSATFAHNPDLGMSRFHANQKPIGLIREFLELSSDRDDLVLDPFGGSGSVALACQQLNRRFITFELSERMCQIIRQRLTDNIGGDNAITGETNAKNPAPATAPDMD
jgi:DNA modification methylase